MANWTVQTLLEATRTFFQERGSPSARLDAEMLLAHVLGVDRTRLYMQYDRPVADEEREKFRELVRRRAATEPIAYLTGSRGFWTLDLHVDSRVLIPRPETEHAVEAVVDFVGEERDRAWRIVDVGTGSGAIALALASELENARIVATDVSADALAVATANAERLGLRERVSFVASDLLDAMVRRGSRADIVVSNPPYVAESDEIDAAVKQWEPATALFAPDDGLALIRRLVEQAAAVLRPGGLLVIEHGAGQGEAVRNMAKFVGFVAETRQDYAGHDRLLVACAPGVLELPERPAVSASISATAAVSPAQGAAAGEAAEAPLPVIDLRSL
jgi:release factor glutamine methyltransferase